MFLNVKALVLREVKYKEADRILTLLTAEHGKLTVKARGALRKSSRSAAATQQLTYSELTLFGNRGKWTVNEGSVLEHFEGLRADLAAFALGCYVSECLEALAAEDQEEGELMQLGLNTLFALSQPSAELDRLKAAFEFRLMCLSGYAPELSFCAVCGKEPEAPVLLEREGLLCCRACAGGKASLRLSEASLAALRYLSVAPARRLFSFKLEGEAKKELSRAAEGYLLAQTERRYPTLDYFKDLTKGTMG